MPEDEAWRFWIDRGGTFTDIVARAPDGRLLTQKLLSEDPARAQDAAAAGIRALLGLPAGAPIPAGLIHSVKMGTTVATNALLQRRGARVLLLVNRGFADLWLIGDQTRPRLFDLQIVRPPPLYERVAEISGRLAADGTELEAPDPVATGAILESARADGITACAIVLMHAWKYPEHERKLAALARAAGFIQVSASHEVSPQPRLVPRGDTTLADAYLSPVLRVHVDRLAGELGGTKLYFMQSHGGLAEAHAFRGKDAVLSGPAGGLVGAARTAAAAGHPRIVTFDMGGTSTDVALHDGRFEHAAETRIAGVRLQVPMLAIHTVAAGGGSILGFDGARLRVGPESAGADPGPACYRRGGPLTVTDANLALGKIQPRHFPSIFGPGGDAPLDVAIVAEKFAHLAADIARATGRTVTPHGLAEDFIRIATANMANAIRHVSVEKGRDPAGFTLACFGGAGGQHACLVADELGMATILIHPLAGVLSAYGMGLASQSAVRTRGMQAELHESCLPEIETTATGLAAEVRAALLAQGADHAAIEINTLLHLQYRGTDSTLPVALAPLSCVRADFAALHRTRFGFDTPGRPIMVDSLEVTACAQGEAVHLADLPRRTGGLPAPLEIVPLHAQGTRHMAPVHDRASLRAGDVLEGPALIREANATTIVEPGWQAETTRTGDLLLRRRTPAAAVAPDLSETTRPDPMRLELFNNLFMHVAEQAGLVLKRAGSSVNIRERLDFSCAIFDAQGALVANAPHVPVHLGAMGDSVRTILRLRAGTLRPGDVVALNNPFNGGTHLPDMTVITPIFGPDGALRFLAANRGHHADIGGTTPGSTPADARTLAEEGVVIDNFLLVSGGDFHEDSFRALLAAGPWPARAPDTNVADIRAQIAANAAAAAALATIVARHGWPMVHAYLGHVMDNAAASVRRLLGHLRGGTFTYAMETGGSLQIAIAIDRAAGTARIDFTGTGAQHAGSFNAPPAVTRACVLYVLRCLVGTDIPLNDGCLAPIDIIIPPGTFLSPAPGAAVVAGNTEVSQGVAAALFGALGALASGQATMNNFLFGDATHQYYETICGGAGAGPTFAGASAVQTHMTNTRMTDPEILELQYPVRLEAFAIRRGSGGAGAQAGGDGAIRRIRFLAPLHATLVASRRTLPPFGLAGGAPGAPGRQWLEQADGTRIDLPALFSRLLATGDLIHIETPGGGGYGPAAGAPAAGR